MSGGRVDLINKLPPPSRLRKPQCVTLVTTDSQVESASTWGTKRRRESIAVVTLIWRIWNHVLVIFWEINMKQWPQMRALVPSWCAGSCRTKKRPLSPSDHLVGGGATPVWPLFHLHQLAYQKPTRCATRTGVSIGLRAKHKTKIESAKTLPFVILSMHAILSEF